MERDEITFIYDDEPASRKQARRHVSKVVRGREHRQRAKQPFIQETFPHRSHDKAPYNKAETKPKALSETPTHSKRFNSNARALYVHVFDSNGSDTDLQHVTGSSEAHPGLTRITTDVVDGLATQLDENSIDNYFSAARTDPFNALPIMLDAESAKCLDHFNTSMPYLEFCVYEGSPLIPSRHVAFRAAIETPAALHAIIATAATHLAGLYGIDSAAVIQRHHGQALTLLRKDVLTVDRSNWSRVAQSMTEIAAGDDFRGQIQHSQLHLNGLRELMHTFGGLRRLCSTPKVQLLVCYVLNGATAAYFPTFQWSPEIFNKVTRILCDSSRTAVVELAELLDVGLDVSQGGALTEIYHHVGGFCNFTDKLKDTRDPVIGRLRRIVPRYFQKDSHLCQRLAVSTQDQDHFGGLGPKGNHRISCLMTIILHLLKLSEACDVEGIILYLEKLHFFNYQNLRLLQFLLLQDGTKPRMNDAEMSWEVTRLMQVYKTLGEGWRQAVNDALIGLLTAEGSADPDIGLTNTDATVAHQWSFTTSEVMEEVLGNLIFVDDRASSDPDPNIDVPADKTSQGSAVGYEQQYNVFEHG